MSSPITLIQPGLAAPVRVAGPQTSSGTPFESVLAEAIERVENYRTGAEQAAGRFLAGADEDLHKVALATQQAELSFELFLAAKNKVVQAYQEIMRMQL
jgi:flagellar hook-basal body complex protein FliE